MKKLLTGILLGLTIILVSCSQSDISKMTMKSDSAIEDIDSTLIGKSKAGDSFSVDVEHGGLGVAHLQDSFWIKYISKALTFENKVDISPSTASTFDMLIKSKEETIKVKLWLIDGQVYYSKFPDKDLFQMSDKDAGYFNFVTKEIFKDL